jgi:hypothetical protein
LLCNYATSLPLPRDYANGTLVARTQPFITQDEYETYFKKHFPATDRYLLYSGRAEDQIKVFQAKNPSYLYYGDLLNAPNTEQSRFSREKRSKYFEKG